jgi:hypothetical protein
MVDEARNPYNPSMDEILIEGRVFVSSKQAAKITGYAKDYVGQLCREGRVEARLVGRNWYVLEDSIREHRFGKGEEEAKLPEAAEPSAADRLSAWQKPQYEAEMPAFVPDLAPKLEPAAALPSPAIQDMQSAWKEWFEEKKPSSSVLPDGSDGFRDEYLPVMAPEAPVQAAEAFEEEEEVSISRISREPAHQAPEAEEESEVALHRSYASRSTGERIPVSSVPVVDLSSNASGKGRKDAPIRIREEREGASGVARAVLVVIALAAALVALVGTGNAERLLAGTSFDFGAQKSIVDFLGGTSTYENSL